MRRLVPLRVLLALLVALYGRAEYAETNEPVAGPGRHHGPTFNVGKVSSGAIRDFRLGPNVRLGIGAQYARNFMPDGLAAPYGGEPGGAMAFIRLRVE
ncbi:hypothetical protein [Sphingosinicella sp.]|uniref:hypothetical protein n=1 Tax=Sphingosinicella sp. TaxID=1917971 RepID=UPI0040383801